MTNNIVNLVAADLVIAPDDPVISAPTTKQRKRRPSVKSLMAMAQATGARCELEAADGSKITIMPMGTTVPTKLEEKPKVRLFKM
jgi:hypothetical protein